MKGGQTVSLTLNPQVIQNVLYRHLAIGDGSIRNPVIYLKHPFLR
jgi:hypothetical protein